MAIYRITGAMEDTGGDVRFEVEATDEGMAEKVAASRGVLVQSIEAMGASGRTLKEEAAERADADARERAVAEEARRENEIQGRRAQAQNYHDFENAVVRFEDGRPIKIRPGQVRLNDLVEIKDGKAYLRVRQHGFIGGIVVGVALGIVLLFVGLFVLSGILVAEVVGGG